MKFIVNTPEKAAVINAAGREFCFVIANSFYRIIPSEAWVLTKSITPSIFDDWYFRLISGHIYYDKSQIYKDGYDILSNYWMNRFNNQFCYLSFRDREKMVLDVVSFIKNFTIGVNGCHLGSSPKELLFTEDISKL